MEIEIEKIFKKLNSQKRNLGNELSQLDKNSDGKLSKIEISLFLTKYVSAPILVFKFLDFFEFGNNVDAVEISNIISCFN